MYTPLYIKTDNSLQESIIKIDDLINFAIKNNIKSLTITDNNMYGVIEFYKKCINNNIKPIIGLEIKYNNNEIVLYAINYNGYKNLLKLSTIQSERPVEQNDLCTYSKDLICIVPYQNLEIYNNIKLFYKYNFISYKTDEEYEKISLSNKIYMNKALYLVKQDKQYIKYIDAIRETKTIDLILDSNELNYIQTEEEYNFFHQESIENNKFIENLCNVEIPFHQKLMPCYDNKENIDSFSFLKKKCIEGLKYHFGKSIGSIYQERLKYELDIINRMGFCDYFLIVANYVNYARNHNIIVGTGRGSAVGSLVSYCLKITLVDPIKYNLLFERFLNPERISMPDIDIDFEHEKREEIIDYCKNKYGEKRVVPIISFGTLGAKQAIRDVAKTLNIESSLVDILCKLLDSKLNLQENYKTNNKIKELLERKEILKECYKIALKFEGLKRHTSLHAAGVIMSNIDLDEVIPLDKSHDFYVSGYDMTYLEELGLLKMDFLAIKYLTIIHNIIDSINEDYNLNINFDEIPLNDPLALSVFNKADTVGIFQFESEGMINFLRKLKVTNMDDLFAAIALFRPGPMQNISTYINRKNNFETIDYIDSSLEKVLKPTYGIMIYQEQIMQIAHIMADYTLGEADMLRKAMSKKKKDILLKEKERFTTRALKKGYDESIINKVYDLMLKFASYGFNKSHSVGYSMIAYKMAYLKAHYPKNFIICLLSMEVQDENKTKQYIYEAKKHNIKILEPDVNLSGKNYNIEKTGIRYPLSNIKNIGIISSEVIINERKNGNYKSVFDFVSRCYGKSITKKTLESLILSGALTSFGYNKKTLIENLDSIINYGELIRDLDSTLALEPEIKIYEEYTSKELMEQELSVFGFYFKNNPIITLKQKYKNIINLNNLEFYFDKVIDVIVIIDKLKEINTSKQEKMCFINGSDELANADIVVFPKTYETLNNLKEKDIVLINGKVEKRFDKYQIIANKIQVIKVN